MARSDRHAHGRARMPVCFALASFLAGCSAQVDGDYQGEPLATIAGNVSAAQDALAADQQVSAAILWVVEDRLSNSYQPKFIGDRIPVRGSFPANFTLDVYRPPPPSAEARLSSNIDVGGISIPEGTGLGVWQGFLVAIDAKARDEDVHYEDILGVDTGHKVIYIDGAATALDMSGPVNREGLMQGLRWQRVSRSKVPLGPGYHLAKVNPEYGRGLLRLHGCGWAGTCVHWIFEAQQAWADWNFRRCTELFPEYPTCSAPFSALASGEPDTSLACGAQLEVATDPQSCFDDANRRLDGVEPYLENAADLSDPITIQMGMTLWDVPL